MQRLKGRLDRVAKALAPHEGKRMRVIACGVCKPGNLAEATCSRAITNGCLTECVSLEGRIEDITDEQLEEFIQSFPIQDNDALPGRRWA